MDNRKNNHNIKKTMPGRRSTKHLCDKKIEAEANIAAVVTDEEMVDNETIHDDGNVTESVSIADASAITESETKTDNAEKNTPQKVSKKKKKGNQKPLIVAAIVVGLIAVIVIALVIISQKESTVDVRFQNDNYMEKIQSLDIVTSGDEAINKFFADYYNGLSAGDIESLKSMFDKPNSAKVSDEISTLVEAYNNLIIYTAPGIKENEMAVFVRNDVKFYNINTLAPSLDCFYVTIDSKDSSIKIRSDMFENADIIRYLTLCSYRDPIKTLLTDTNSALDSALNSDKELKNLYIVMQSMTNAVLNEVGEE